MGLQTWWPNDWTPTHSFSGFPNVSKLIWWIFVATPLTILWNPKKHGDYSIFTSRPNPWLLRIHMILGSRFEPPVPGTSLSIGGLNGRIHLSMEDFPTIKFRHQDTRVAICRCRHGPGTSQISHPPCFGCWRDWTNVVHLIINPIFTSIIIYLLFTINCLGKRPSLKWLGFLTLGVNKTIDIVHILLVAGTCLSIA